VRISWLSGIDLGLANAEWRPGKGVSVHRLGLSVVLATVFVAASLLPANASPMAALVSVDYPRATWVAANANNYTVSDRPSRYQVNMIVIHDIEGSAAAAIKLFQDPNRAGSAHYVISRGGAVYQMVAEKDIAWHAGNWDYNTRAIGIEHEGYACCNYYTQAEYTASAKLAASICSRWGVPLDRAHVIGHSEVPDPNHPGLYGGSSHHTDPGPYWHWSGYLNLARQYAAALPSPPHMGPAPIAESMEGGVMLRWKPAQSCHDPITSYTLTGAGGLDVTVPANQTTLWIPGLVDGTHYSFTVTATNREGSDSMTSTVAVPGRHCDAAIVTATTPSPQAVGTPIAVHATSSGCPNPEYRFGIRTPGGEWKILRWYGGSSWTWNTSGMAAGNYQIAVWARQQGSANDPDTYGFTGFLLTAASCQATSLTPSVAPPQPIGAVVTFSASSTRCSSPEYQFLLLRPGGPGFASVQPYSATATWTFDSTSYPAGVYQVAVWARQAGTSSKFDASFVMTYKLGATACAVSAVTTDVPQPQPAGTRITFTAQQAGCTKQYKFWLLAPGAKWRVVQNYGPSRTWAWSTAGYRPGPYQVSVWEGSAATPTKYETYAVTSFTLGPAMTCNSVTLGADTTPPQNAGVSVTFTAAASGCSHPTYEFLLLAPRATSWVVARSWGSVASWTWNTAGFAPGTYQVVVWTRRSGSTGTWESYAMKAFQIIVPTCGSATIDASPSSSQTAGTSVTFAASSSACSQPRYQFLVAGAGGLWKIAQPFSLNSSFSWSTTGLAPGVYQVAVWVAATGSVNVYDVYAIQQYTLT